METAFTSRHRLLWAIFLSLVGSAIWAVITILPEAAIAHYRIIQRPHLDQAIAALAAKTHGDYVMVQSDVANLATASSISSLRAEIESMRGELKSMEMQQSNFMAEQESRNDTQKAEVQSAIQNLGHRISAIGQPVNQPLRIYHQPVQLYSRSGENSVELQLTVPSDSIGIFTAFADSSRKPRGKDSLLAVEILADTSICALGQTSLVKGEHERLAVSAACLVELSARPSPYIVKATRKGHAGQPGGVHLQCAVFKKTFDFSGSLQEP